MLPPAIGNDEVDDFVDVNVLCMFLRFGFRGLVLIILWLWLRRVGGGDGGAGGGGGGGRRRGFVLGRRGREPFLTDLFPSLEAGVDKLFYFGW